MDISDGQIDAHEDIGVSPSAKKKEPGRGRETRPRQLGLPGRSADGSDVEAVSVGVAVWRVLKSSAQARRSRSG